jgi:hypothetical protein
MSSIKRPYLRGKQTQILGGQQRGNGSAKMISMALQFIIINLKKISKICVCLPRKYGRFMLLIDNNLLLPGAKLHILINIYRK